MPNTPFVHLSGGLFKPMSWHESLYDTPLVYINGHPLPQSSTYASSTAVLVDSARNAAGIMIGAVIREELSKIELTWRFLEIDDWVYVCSFKFKNNVRFYDHTKGTFVTKEMYKSDVTSGVPFLNFDGSGLPRGHSDCRVAYIEV